MDDLPTDYTEHNLPLVLLSGLGDEDDVGGDGGGLPRQGSGTKLVIQTPECEGERARHLLQQFVNRDGSFLAWNSNALPGPTGTLRFRMQAIGRVSMLFVSPRIAKAKAHAPTGLHLASPKGRASGTVPIDRNAYQSIKEPFKEC